MKLRVSLLLIALLAITTLIRPANPGFASPEAITITVSNTNDSGNGSLRQAILNANASTATEIYIGFDIPGAAPHVIQPLSRLPDIDPGIQISGLTQPDSDCSAWPPTLTVVLRPGNLDTSGYSGLYLLGSNRVQGLVVQGFTVGINLGGDNNVLWCNFIGTNPAGTATASNSVGVMINVGASNNVVGGVTPTTRNLISGNFYGISFKPAASNNTIWGNYIGTQADGTSSLGNDSSGIHIDGALHNLIGGSTTSQGNVIAFNGGEGIRVLHQSPNQAFDNTISHNRIYANVNPGIDLGGDGVTANDSSDADTGDNNLQNFPDSLAALHIGTKIILMGKLSTHANSTYQVEFFRSATCAPSGYGDAQTFVAAVSATTAANGQAQFATGANYVGGGFISATATDLSSGDTSEFSRCTAIQAGSSIYLPMVVRK